MSVTLLRRADYRRMRWKNGLGWTTEILRQPDHDGFDLRLSVAEIESDAPFSPFAASTAACCCSRATAWSCGSATPRRS